jgi:hypothetical protein
MLPFRAASLRLWDTAVRERYRSFVPLYPHRLDGVM